MSVPLTHYAEQGLPSGTQHLYSHIETLHCIDATRPELRQRCGSLPASADFRQKKRLQASSPESTSFPMGRDKNV
jgi:hypothetical protein